MVNHRRHPTKARCRPYFHSYRTRNANDQPENSFGSIVEEQMPWRKEIVARVHRRIALDSDADRPRRSVHRYPSVFEYDHLRLERRESRANMSSRRQRPVPHCPVEIEEY